MSKVNDFIGYLGSRIGNSIYVWGADGECMDDMTDPVSWIKRKESTTVNEQRSINLYNKLKRLGTTNIRAFDCSGLVYWALKQIGLDKGDMAAKTLWAKCKLRNDTGLAWDDLREGDFVCHHNGDKITHIGVVVPNDYTVECIGRDDGVVKFPLTARREYWNRWARWDAFEAERKAEADKQPEKTEPIIGDADGDGQVTAADSAHILRWLVGLVPDINRDNADFDRNGEVNSSDASAILRHLTETAPKSFVVVKGGSVYVRDRENSEGKILGVARKGQRFPLLGVAQSGWYQIDYRGLQEAYISNKSNLTQTEVDNDA